MAWIKDRSSPPSFTVERREVEGRRKERKPQERERKDSKQKPATPIADQVSKVLRNNGRFPKDWY